MKLLDYQRKTMKLILKHWILENKGEYTEEDDNTLELFIELVEMDNCIRCRHRYNCGETLGYLCISQYYMLFEEEGV